MTERDVYEERIPQIAELILLCRQMSEDEFCQWKKDVLKRSDRKAHEFLRKVFFTIEDNL